MVKATVRWNATELSVLPLTKSTDKGTHTNQIKDREKLLLIFIYLFACIRVLVKSCGILLGHTDSLVVARGLPGSRLVDFRSHSAQAQQLHLTGLAAPAAGGILVPQPGIKPTPAALHGGFLTTGPLGQLEKMFFKRKR